MIKVGICGAPSSGKCLKKGTRVIMHDLSLKCVEDITVGDKLLGVNGEERNVMSISNGVGQLYKIEQRKGDNYYVTGNHILSLVISGRCGGHRANDIVHITVNDWFNKTKEFKIRAKGYTNKCIQFNTKVLPIEPYYLGLWLGDGHSANPERITNSDDEVINYLSEYANRYNITCKKVGNSLCTYSVTGGVIKPNKYLRNEFRKMNLINNKHIPFIYKTSDVNQRLELLAGIVDSDAHVANNCIDLCMKNTPLINDILILARSLGFKCVIRDVSRTCTTNGYTDIYKRITISGDLKLIPTKISRKIITTQSLKRDCNRTRINIVADSIGEYYGFELDGDQLFMLEDFTVTHNSTTAAGLFYMYKRRGERAELVTEFIREELNRGFKLGSVADQFRIYMKQKEREDIIPDEINIMITDSPIYLSLYYALDYARRADNQNDENILFLFEQIFKERNRYDILILLKRTKEYVSDGTRLQTAEESDKIYNELLIMFELLGIGVILLDDSDTVVEQIAELIDQNL